MPKIKTVFTQLYPVFDRYQSAGSAVFEECAKAGLDTWELARPTATHWAAARFKLTVVEGQRGLTFREGQKETSAARQAMHRIAKCFETEAVKSRKTGRKTGHKTDPVERLIKRLQKLDGNQKRRIKNAMGW
jgi:hypothetical protein